MEFEFISFNINYGKFNDYSVELEPGMNIFYGQNESGKSTIFSFILSMLYGQYNQTSKNLIKDKKVFEKYRPWFSEDYSGSIYLKSKNSNYHLYRNFLNDSLSLRNLDQGTNIDLDDPRSVGYFLTGKSYEEFKELISLDLKDPLIIGTDISIESLIKDGFSSSEKQAYEKIKLSLKARNNEIGTDRVSQKLLGRVNKNIEHTKLRINSIKENKYELDEKIGQKRDIEKKLRYYRNLDLYKQLSEKNKGEISLEEYEEMLDLIEDFSKIDDKISNKKSFLLSFILSLAISSIIYLVFEKLSLSFLILALSFFALSFVQLKKNKDKLKKKKKLKAIMGRKLIEAGASNLEEYRSFVGQEKKDKLSLFNPDFDYTSVGEKLEYYEEASEQVIKEIYIYKEKLQEKRNLYEHLFELEKEREAILEELEINNLLIDAIDNLSTKAFYFFKNDLEEKISQSINYFSNGKYKRILLEKDFSLLLYDQDKKDYVGLHSLSLGTIELVNLAYKLTLREFKEGARLPMILDNSLVFLDSQRKERFLQFLSQYSRTNQLIYFTNKVADLKTFSTNDTNIIYLGDSI